MNNTQEPHCDAVPESVSNDEPMYVETWENGIKVIRCLTPKELKRLQAHQRFMKK